MTGSDNAAPRLLWRPRLDLKQAVRGSELIMAEGPSIKYVTLFWPILTPPPLCHTLSHIPGPPRKYVTHLGPLPRFLVGLVQKSRTKIPCTNSISIVRGSFCPVGFVWVGFCPFPLLSQYICYNRKLNITLNFMFYMYAKNLYKRDVTWQNFIPSRHTTVSSSLTIIHCWPTSLCHRLSHLLGPLPSSVTYFMDGSWA